MRNHFNLPVAQRASSVRYYVSSSKAILDSDTFVYSLPKKSLDSRENAKLSLQIQLSGKGRASEEFIASKYALFMLKAPLKDGFQTSLSPPLAKLRVATPWISALTSGGNSKGMIDQSQSKGLVTSFTLRSRNS